MHFEVGDAAAEDGKGEWVDHSKNVKGDIFILWYKLSLIFGCLNIVVWILALLELWIYVGFLEKFFYFYLFIWSFGYMVDLYLICLWLRCLI